MKHLLGILFCFNLLTPMLGSYTWLHFQKSQVRKEVKARMLGGITKEELVFFQFSKQDSASKVRWEHSKEFEYEGQMYDVVETTHQGDTLLYWCWSDEAETELNRKLDKLAVDAWDENPENEEKEAHLLQFVKSLYCQQLFSWKTQAPLSNDRISHHKTSFYFSLQQVPFYPPPEKG